MFAADKGNGGTIRLVMLPYERQSYRGKENVLHALAEMFDWFHTDVTPDKVVTGDGSGNESRIVKRLNPVQT